MEGVNLSRQRHFRGLTAESEFGWQTDIRYWRVSDQLSDGQGTQQRRAGTEDRRLLCLLRMEAARGQIGEDIR